MAKAKSVFVCSDCGYESPKWLGKCPACNSWNTFYEQKIEKYTEENKIEKKINNGSFYIWGAMGYTKAFPLVKVIDY